MSGPSTGTEFSLAFARRERSEIRVNGVVLFQIAEVDVLEVLVRGGVRDLLILLER